jgi:hypothetical protein
MRKTGSQAEALLGHSLVVGIMAVASFIFLVRWR